MKVDCEGTQEKVCDKDNIRKKLPRKWNTLLTQVSNNCYGVCTQQLFHAFK